MLKVELCGLPDAAEHCRTVNARTPAVHVAKRSPTHLDIYFTHIYTHIYTHVHICFCSFAWVIMLRQFRRDKDVDVMEMFSGSCMLTKSMRDLA